MNSGCFQIYRVYFISLNAGKFFGSWIQTVWRFRKWKKKKKKKEICCFVFTSSTKREVRLFHFVSQSRGKQRKIQQHYPLFPLPPSLFCSSFFSVFFFFFAHFTFNKGIEHPIWSFSCIPLLVFVAKTITLSAKMSNIICVDCWNR